MWREQHTFAESGEKKISNQKGHEHTRTTVVYGRLVSTLIGHCGLPRGPYERQRCDRVQRKINRRHRETKRQNRNSQIVVNLDFFAFHRRSRTYCSIFPRKHASSMRNARKKNNLDLVNIWLDAYQIPHTIFHGTEFYDGTRSHDKIAVIFALFMQH